MDQPQRSERRRPPVHFIPLPYLLIVPALLAVATTLLLFLHADTDLAMLYSQCHARSRLPWLTQHVPGFVGTPSCFLISFFVEALASARAAAIMAVVLAGVAGLLTVSTVESARACNAPSALLARPTLPWLVFNLAGGALVWQLVLVPAALRRARAGQLARRSGAPVLVGAAAADPDAGVARRQLRRGRAEAVAIPVAVALGYGVPSVAMLVLDDPVAVAVWLVFPIWVALVRQAVRFVVSKMEQGLGREESGDAAAAQEMSSYVHLESSPRALVLVYGLPVLCSALAHGFLIWSMFQPDDRRAMTRLTLGFVEIDAMFIGATVLYWILAEAGWVVALATVLVAALLGPGAGICIGWILREGAVEPKRSVTAVAVGARREAGEATERSPLLQ